MHISCPNLLKQSCIKHGFFTRSGGLSVGLYASLNCGYGSGDDLAVVEKNRSRVGEALGVGHESLCTAYQIHSPTAVTLKQAWNWRDAPEADALVTKTPGVALGILTADCLPVLFADSTNNVIGAAHAGWKGAFSGVIETTIDAMTQLGATAATISATIGPSIAQSSYEVGPEFFDNFIKQNADNKIYFIPSHRPRHHMFDLKSYVKDRLSNAGVAQINVLAHDTCLQENDFFSFRRATLRDESVYGRQISAIVLDK